LPFSSDIAFMAQNPAIDISVIAASLPPVSMTSACPALIRRCAPPMALAAEAQAETAQ
jgi:hypothetical protein